jgi:hypothetical protein
MFACGSKTFDGGVALAVCLGYRNLAGAHRNATVMHGAGTANAYTTTVLGARQLKQIAQYPEKRYIRRGRDLVPCAVDGYRNNRHGIFQAAFES